MQAGTAIKQLTPENSGDVDRFGSLIEERHSHTAISKGLHPDGCLPLLVHLFVQAHTDLFEAL